MIPALNPSQVLLRLNRGLETRTLAQNSLPEPANSFQDQYIVQPKGQQLPSNFFQGSNNVRCIECDDSITIHLPAYIYMKYDNLIDINFESKTVSLHGSTILNIYYGQLPQQWVQQISQSLIVSIGNRMHLNMDEEQFAEDLTISMKMVNNPKRKLLTYIIKGIFHTVMQANIFMCPFQDVQVDFSVVPRTHPCQFLGKVGYVKLNPMGKYVKNTQIFSVNDMIQLRDRTSHCEYTLRKDGCKIEIIGKYTVSSNKPEKSKNCLQIKKKEVEEVEERLEYSLKKIRKTNHNKKRDKYHKIIDEYGLTEADAFFINEFKEFHEGGKPIQSKEVHFKLKLIKDPLQTFLSVLLPLAFISVVNFSVYLMDNVFNDKVATIATLLITYTTFMPTIRQRTPITPRLTLIDILVISVMLLSLLSLIRSILDRGKDLEMTKNQWRQDPLFWIPLAIWTAILIIFIGMFIKIQTMILRKSDEEIQSKRAQQGDFQTWGNYRLDKGYQLKGVQKVTPYAQFVRNNYIFQRLWIERLLRESQVMQRPIYIPSNTQDKQQKFKEQIKFYQQFWSSRQELPIYITSFMPLVQYFYIRVQNMCRCLFPILNRPDSLRNQQKFKIQQSALRESVQQLRQARKRLLEGYMGINYVDDDEIEFTIKKRAQNV